ncbi:carbohydrate-binding domain-containing protein [Clostridiales bacterium]|nr:carbohydrate-binding domain-containing protein [Clostridiales bacterium]GFI55507.1 carbohydrate-binding domain-containing protein [Clostridiales bacterium]
MKKTCMLLLALLILSACTRQDSTIYKPVQTSETEIESSPKTDFDFIDTWDSQTAAIITFNENNAQIEGTGAALADDTTLCIDKEGTYILQGTFAGSVLVSLAKTEKAQIVLNGVTIKSQDTAAIYIKSADKVVITLAPNTENTLSDGSDYVPARGAEPNACLFSKDDLTINGAGILNVFGNCNNGIGTKNDLKIVSGNLTVNANKNALKGNDSVQILDGNITVTMCADAIKSDNETDPNKGKVIISGGKLQLNCADDGIQATQSVTVSESAAVAINAADKPVNCDGTVHIDEGSLILS